MTRLLILLTTISLTFMSVQAVFAASVTITPAGNGVFIIQGNQMDGVCGIELDLTYDSSSLASPSVSQGALVSGTMFMANPAFSPSSIKIAAVRGNPLSGSGQIATVTFARQSGTGGVTAATVKLIDINGASINAQAAGSGGDATLATSNGIITTPGVPFSQSSSTSTTNTSTTTTATTTASTMPTSLGTVSMPADVQTGSGTKPSDTPGVPAKSAEAAAVKPADPPAEVKPAPVPERPEEIKVTSYKGVLENFRVYKGEKSPAIFIALFNKEIAPTIRQEPAVALSDGVTAVKMLVTLGTAGDKSPNFSLNGATLVSLNKTAPTAWTIAALPQAGIMHASLTILTESDLVEFPLTLAPPMEGISPVEADFAAFLADSGAVAPRRDLNGDGRHDYLDDFIYTANYLTGRAAAGKTMISGTAPAAAAPASLPAPSAEGSVSKQKPVFYTLSAGETVSRPKLDILIKKLKSSGLQPVVREENKTMDVYRLVNECFSTKGAAQKRLTEVARREKQAFIVHDAERHCVVAASYFSNEAARTAQNEFARKGLQAEIVKALVPQTSWQVTVGRFNDSQSAETELKRLAQRGIDVVMVPQDR